jgi:hypothetical protein
MGSEDSKETSTKPLDVITRVDAENLALIRTMISIIFHHISHHQAHGDRIKVGIFVHVVGHLVLKRLNIVSSNIPYRYKQTRQVLQKTEG